MFLMDRPFLDYLILNIMQSFGTERSVSAGYHLLKGKRSSQTIQDGIVFHISSFFGLFPKLSNNEYLDRIEQLKKDDLIRETDEANTYSITVQGNQLLKQQLNQTPIPSSLNGWLYRDETDRFWLRFSLFVQSLSHIAHNATSFIPVTTEREVQMFVKSYLFSIRYSKEQLTSQMYKELETIFCMLDEIEASILLHRLTSFQRTGLTVEQCAQVLHLDKDYVYIKFVAILHSIMSTILNEDSRYPILSGLMQGMKNNYNLTSSTQTTFNYWQKGYTLDEIATVRELKASTIEDHIVEIALNVPDFDLSPFLKVQDLERIHDTMTRLNTHKLKRIKEALHDEYSYFQIRLALALSKERV